MIAFGAVNAVQGLLVLVLFQCVSIFMVSKSIRESAARIVGGDQFIWSLIDGNSNSTTSAQVEQQEKLPLLGQDKPRSVARGRFPSFGTDDFARTCNWTASPLRTPKVENCTLVVSPSNESNEGISWWTAVLAMGHAYSLQTGCRLVADYGPGVDVGRVLKLTPGSVGFAPVEWIAPRDSIRAAVASSGRKLQDEVSECSKSKRCSFVVSDRWSTKQLRSIQLALSQDEPIAPVPPYRWAYSGTFHTTPAAEVKDIMRALPGYTLQTGMACSLNRMFELAPTAAEYVPSVFSTLIPALRDDSALVFALYIRTGRTDAMAHMEAKGETVPSDVERGNNPSSMLKWVSNCALKFEEEKLSQSSASGGLTSVVWMIVTDSPLVKTLAMESFHGQNITVTANNQTAHQVTRNVLTTTSRGVQTRKNRNPSTADFAEGLLDWFLIGESDVVISHGGVSFGTTGSLRTARPQYATKDKCSKLDWVLDKPL